MPRPKRTVASPSFFVKCHKLTPAAEIELLQLLGRQDQESRARTRIVDDPVSGNQISQVTIVGKMLGSIQWFNENCEETDYNAGESWTEGSQLHYFRVVGKTGIHLTAFFITAQGAALRTDEPAPACAAALGLT